LAAQLRRLLREQVVFQCQALVSGERRGGARARQRQQRRGHAREQRVHARARGDRRSRSARSRRLLARAQAVRLRSGSSRQLCALALHSKKLA